MLLNKHNFDVARFAPNEGNRHDINAIRITQDGTTATDGHCIVTVSAPDMKAVNFPAIDGFEPFTPEEPIMLSKKDAEHIGKAIPRKEVIRVLNHACVGKPNGTQNFAVTDLDTHQVFKTRISERTFPKDAHLWPTEEPAFKVCLNASYLAELAKAVHDFGSAYVIVSLYAGDAGIKPVKLEAKTDGGQTWKALLMPCRL